MKKAIFPGSFDPFTLGHMDVLNLGLEIFDHITIAVGYNTSKKGYFTPDTRVEIIKQAVEHLTNVDVCKYNCLTTSFCEKNGINHIIRGIRTVTDFELENNIAQANKKLAPSISTVILPATGENSYISSTLVRELIIHGADTSDLMPNRLDLTKFIKNRNE